MKKITVSFATYEAEHEGDPSETGWIDEEGVEFASTLEAAVWLQKEGAVHPSSSHPHDRIWFQSDIDENFRTGSTTERSFHLSGFTARELATLHKVITDMTQLGHPDSLSYCWADEWFEFASDLVIEDGIITGSPDASLIGMPAAAAYIERFAVDRQEEVDWHDGPDGSKSMLLATNDAVFFATLDQPVITRQISDAGIVYSLQPRSAFGQTSNQMSL